MLMFLSKNTLAPANINKRIVRPGARQEGTERDILAHEAYLSDLEGNLTGKSKLRYPTC